MMKSVVDSSHTHHHHTTSPTGRLDKITNPPTPVYVLRNTKQTSARSPLHTEEKSKMISEWNQMENEERQFLLGFDFLAVERTRWLDLHNNQR
jgi:hypothetical protein